MSIGDGWNQIMEDYAAYILPPLCVEDESFFKSDCGSTSYARFLFISWNILSMYIFTSLFVSLIYESFSDVYQYSSGLGKKGQALFPKKPFLAFSASFLASLKCAYTVPRTLFAGFWKTFSLSQPGGGSAQSLLQTLLLASRLAEIDPGEVRRARARYNLFYEEVMVSADVDCGISFTTVLMILAHYKVISDNNVNLSDIFDGLDGLILKI
ncbi:hypothetical protein BDZ45DRAFT_754207 [Acephala macrosclerotiorum]|nr:hypothetical protein BDZ45DRAFT_754207 [Acephala macrosclerotiorum]